MAPLFGEWVKKRVGGNFDKKETLCLGHSGGEDGTWSGVTKSFVAKPRVGLDPYRVGTPCWFCRQNISKVFKPHPAKLLFAVGTKISATKSPPSAELFVGYFCAQGGT